MTAHEAPPTAADAGGATYSGVDAGTVTMVNGVWESPAPFAGASKVIVKVVHGFHIIGDLTGDGTPEALVLLTQSAGGSGTFEYLAALGRRTGAIVNIGTAALGDRVQIRSARIADRQVVMEVVRAGPADAMCCPSQKVQWTFALAEGRLIPTSEHILGTASVEDIGAAEWVLIAFSSSRAAFDPPPTLRFQDGTFVGFGGCNRYTGRVSAGSQPGTLSVGSIVATRMACPGKTDEIERRFFEALGAVTHYRFVAGRLVLSYPGSGTQTLIFGPR